jgi:putative hydrolase of the HAD superfamily
MHRETLLVDADDTLWENNRFFEQAINHYLDLMEREELEREAARAKLNQTEKKNIPRHGYGTRSFVVSMEETYRVMAGARTRRSVLDEIARVGHELGAAPTHIFEGVPETLDYLSAHHRMILFTKGDATEQTEKIERSGLRRFFEALEIANEKSTDIFKKIIDSYRILKRHGWMVGNSPRSDINPALRAGLNAVFIPSAIPWDFEQEAVRSGEGKLIVVRYFRDLRRFF